MPNNTETLQQWLTAVLVGGGNLPQKITRAEQLFGLQMADTVIETATVSAERRVGIYATGYMLRLLECMQADLPSLHAFWGEELFVMFARGYLLTHPSHSPSLFDLTQDFAAFLDGTRPRSDDMDAATNARYDLPAELVRIERARLAAMRSHGTEGIEGEADVASLFSFFSGQEVYVQAHPCLQLLRLKMPLSNFYQQLMAGAQPDLPSPAPAWMAVTRTHYRLRLLEVQAWQFHLLEALQQVSQAVPVGEIAPRVAARAGIGTGQLLADLGLWMPFALEAGLLTSPSPAG